MVSLSLLTSILYQKYVLGTPIYRQMRDWHRLGSNAQDTTFNNWVIQGTVPVESLYRLIHEHLTGQYYLQGDETPHSVLREPGKKATSKSYMWVARSVKRSDEPIVFYAYSDSRSGKFAQRLYANFTRTLQCDGYAGYNLLGTQVVRVGCWSHVRRKFYDAAQGNRNNGNECSVETVGRNVCVGTSMAELFSSRAVTPSLGQIK
ncbi:IS66 family transposase [Lentilactobacillus hilgardii]|uniref:Transposase n=1 Tax=Lentilactobacillus hilgardii TaxID=1588 RepID=A0A6P1E2A8_LENHI|nr:transposase [Lentilactobacillus hilgardii]EEI71666.1 IS66 family element, transposase [Lentilactobacillus hilgardii ATCC 27305]QHB51446.1 transposase [Lentilactobacillus hilgardii]